MNTGALPSLAEVQTLAKMLGDLEVIVNTNGHHRISEGQDSSR